MLRVAKFKWGLLVASVACLALVGGCQRAKPMRTVSWPTSVPISLEPEGPLSANPPAAQASASPAAPAQSDAPPTPTPVVTSVPELPDAPPLAGSTPTPEEGSGPPTEAEYAIGPGDTLSSVAAEYQTSITAIMERNGLTNPDMVRVGQKLTIPVGSGPSNPADSRTVYHTVGRGDTLWKLARRYHTHPREIVAQNGDLISDPDHLSPGTILKITTGTAPVVATHTVRPGESLSSIARASGVTLQELLSANGLANPNLVRAGQVLVIPK